MAIDFPNSPTTGDTYTAGGRTWQWDGTVWAAYGNYPDPTVLKIDTGTNRVGINNTSPTTALDVTGDLTVSGNISGGSITGAGMTVSSTAPSSPSEGEMWYNEVSGRTFVYYDDGSSQQWVEFGVPPNGSKIALASYADSAARTTALPSPSEADLSYLQDTNSVEVYDGSAWATVGGGVRTTFTPASYTNITIGNGTETAHYTLVGDLMCVEYVLIWGSTTSISANPVIGLPAGYSRATGTDVACGQGMLRDQGTRNYMAFIQTNLNGLSIHSITDTATATFIDVVSPTWPFTWTTGDAIRFNATFQVTT